MAWAPRGTTGTGIGVAIIDSGVNSVADFPVIFPAVWYTAITLTPAPQAAPIFNHSLLRSFACPRLRFRRALVYLDLLESQVPHNVPSPIRPPSFAVTAAEFEQFWFPIRIAWRIKYWLPSPESQSFFIGVFRVSLGSLKMRQFVSLVSALGHLVVDPRVSTSAPGPISHSKQTVTSP